MIAPTVALAARILVVAVLAYAATVAITAWAVRSRRINPFGAGPKLVRRMSDPIVHPLERRIVRMGGNPQDATLWLVGIAVVGGLLFITLVNWLLALP